MTREQWASVTKFYTTPSDKCFEELRNVCIRFWKLYRDVTNEVDDKYINEKIDRIKNLSNNGPNFVSMVQMIHQNYRVVIAKALSYETRLQVSLRLYGFDSSEFDPFDVFNIENMKE